MAGDLTGESKEICPATGATSRDSHLYSLGVLLAYCYVFGIRDLHKNNIVKTATHLQVIDAEVVLAKLLLPHETLLLPFKEVGPELCGAAHVPWNKFTPEQLAIVLNGYIDTFDCFTSDQSGIVCVFQDLSEDLHTIPVRHILRDTFHYRDRHLTEPEIPFFASEQRQLDRGDIPYFFKFIGNEVVFEIVAPGGQFDRVDLPDVFLKGAAREAARPIDLLCPNRLSEILPTGFLYLAKKLVLPGWNGIIRGIGFEISVSSSSISVALAQGKYSSKR